LKIKKEKEKTQEYHVPALEKGFAILECLSNNGGRTLAELCSSLSLYRTTVFSILRNLLGMGYVRKGENGRYYLGFGLYSLGMSTVRQIRNVEIFVPELAALRDELNQTVHACGFLGNNTVVLEKLEGDSGIIFKSYLGERKPLHFSAGGKAILGFLPRCDFDYYAGGELMRKTKNTITTKEQLMACRKQVQADGYAIDDEEGEPGVFCFGAPVFSSGDILFGAVSISTIKGSIDMAAYGNYTRRIMQAAEKISQKMGYNNVYPKPMWD
jgi:DNA-binding IclR family transcriptional regulator